LAVSSESPAGRSRTRGAVMAAKLLISASLARGVVSNQVDKRSQASDFYNDNSRKPATPQDP
jgi:hypothetical protein